MSYHINMDRTMTWKTEIYLSNISLSDRISGSHEASRNNIIGTNNHIFKEISNSK